MKITFCGAARQVTGSMHLLSLDNGYKILLDCGMDYELKRNPVETQNIFPFNPTDIDAVILTHAHVDHSGNLPALVQQGFSGHIFCTPATADLTEFLLYDSANIQMGNYKKNLNAAKKNRRHLIPKPLYAAKQVKETVQRFYTLNFNSPFQFNDFVEITLLEAGHLLGAASIKIEWSENGAKKSLGFTGDLGRKNSKLVCNPTVMQDLNYLVTECTYGGRNHKPSKNAEDELLSYVLSTCVDIRGRLVIPAFSVGRTQSIVFALHQLKQRGLLPDIKIFVDSPLALRSTGVYEKYLNLLNDEAKTFHSTHGKLFEFENLHYIDGIKAHDDLLNYSDPCIIISSAGMVEGGRIQEHVSNNIENPYSTILIAGFCAEGTLGHSLLQGKQSIYINKKEKRIRARIASTDVFSSHPGSDEIFEYITATSNKNKSNKIETKIFLVHGEESQMSLMQNRLFEIGLMQVEMPYQGQEYKL